MDMNEHLRWGMMAAQVGADRQMWRLTLGWWNAEIVLGAADGRRMLLLLLRGSDVHVLRLC